MDNNLELTTNDAFNDLDIQIEPSNKKKNTRLHRAIKYVFDKDRPPFYHIVNSAFNFVTNEKYSKGLENLTDAQKSENIQGAKNSAKILGGVCTAGLTEGGYALAEKVAPYHYGHIDISWQMLGMIAVGACIAHYSKNFKQWEKDYPVYSAGMKFVSFAYGLTTIADMIIRHL
jgi:hypothetical protein